MALTIDSFTRTVFGNKRAVICNVDFDDSYPTGGESLTPTNLGLRKIDWLEAQPTGGYVFQYDYTNQKLLAYQQTDPADTGGADVPLAQAGSTEDLSGVTDVRVFALGY